MNYRNLAKKLQKNIQIVTSTFESNNLQVLNMACKPYGDDDADLYVYVELASINGSAVPSTLQVKINLYTADDELYMTEYSYVLEHKFTGYDTITICCSDDSHVLEIATKGRLYVTRS